MSCHVSVYHQMNLSENYDQSHVMGIMIMQFMTEYMYRRQQSGLIGRYMSNIDKVDLLVYIGSFAHCLGVCNPPNLYNLNNDMLL